jgi:osmotically-inducible protein OsmY
VQVRVCKGVVTLTGAVDRWSITDLADRLTRQVAGVVDVVNTLSYDYDDRNIGTGVPSGIA